MDETRPDRRPCARARRIVLVLPTETYRADAFTAAAATLGVEVVVATEHTPPLAGSMEDRLVTVDLGRAEASAQRIAALVDRAPIDGVIGVDDQGILIAAHAADGLGLPSNPPDAVAATRDKIDMRRVFEAWGIPQPSFAVLPHDDDAATADLAGRIGFPCVLKPVSLSASTGVIRADSAEQAVAAANRIRRILADHDRPVDEPLLVERFVPGVEVSIEGLLTDGRLEVLAVFDKPDALDGPYFEETIYTTPSRLPADDQEAAIAVATAGCRALGLREGPVHAEVRVRSEGGRPHATVLEIAARSIGGHCSRALTFGTGATLEEVIIRHALGLEMPGRGEVASGVMMLPIPRSGTLRRITGLAAARDVPGVVDLEISATLGRPITALPEGGRYLGFLFARGARPEDVERSLRTAHEKLHVDIEAPDRRPGASPVASPS